MPTRTAPAPYPWAPPRSPWWVGAGRLARDTVRELRAGTTQGAPTGMRLALAPDGQPVYVPTRASERSTTRTIRWAWKRRRALAPLPVAAAYAVLNALPWQAWDVRWLVASVVFAPPLAALAWAWMLTGADRTRATWTILAATIPAYEAWWLLPADRVPPGAVWVLAAGASAWSAYRFRTRPPEPEPDPEEEELDLPWQVRRWNTLVRAEGGILPGALAYFAGDLYPDGQLEDAATEPGDPLAPDGSAPTPLAAPIGFRLAVELVPGRHEVANLRSALGRIAGIYSTGKAGTVLDEVDNEVRAILTFTTRRFLAEVQVWTGPTLDAGTGLFVWVCLADGTPGYGTFWVPGQGVKHRWMIGATGGGKSGALDCFLASALSLGICVLDLTDLKGGASVPHWRYRALFFGTRLEDGVAALRRAVWLCDYRYDVMARLPAVDSKGRPVLVDGQPAYGRTWVDPSAEWPIYLVTVEEWTQLAGHPELGPLAIRLAGRVGALGRQALVALAFTTQPANLDLAFGGNRDLRTNVQSGDVLVMWTDQGTGNLATATRTIDLSRIPQGEPGVGYLVGPAQQRDLRGRVPYVAEPWDAVNATVAGQLGPAELAVLAAADTYSSTGRMEDARRVALDAFPGDPEWAATIDRIMPAGTDPDQVPESTDTTSTDGPLWAAGMVLGDPHATRPDGQRTVLAQLTRGERTTADLRAALGGVSDQGLRVHLNPLLEDALVERTGRGLYALANPTPKDHP